LKKKNLEIKKNEELQQQILEYQTQIQEYIYTISQLKTQHEQQLEDQIVAKQHFLDLNLQISTQLEELQRKLNEKEKESSYFNLFSNNAPNLFLQPQQYQQYPPQFPPQFPPQYQQYPPQFPPQYQQYQPQFPPQYQQYPPQFPPQYPSYQPLNQNQNQNQNQPSNQNPTQNQPLNRSQLKKSLNNNNNLLHKIKNEDGTDKKWKSFEHC